MRSRDKKESGILLAVSSLPSPGGIGTLGEAAYRFVDFLEKSRQHYWQILPLAPVGEGNSPYKSESAFAGEILLIDLPQLMNDRLLNESELAEIPELSAVSVDYDAVREYKEPLLRLAASRFDKTQPEYRTFISGSPWLEDYALFAAIGKETGSVSFKNFETPYKYRDERALRHFALTRRDELDFYRITQYFFYRQYIKLRAYANSRNVRIIGDIPIYVSLDSADVWQNPRVFRLGQDMTPVLVSGVPPDIFSPDGQLWGNPVYDWDYLKKSDFVWWRRRIRHCAMLYDVVRIDHFRAFASYYTVPYGAATARNGRWESGIGIVFFEALKDDFGDLNVIAEDLGGDTPDVKKLVAQSGFPNMKVLQFAFSGDLSNEFLPRNFGKNCVCYTGTHDNDTTAGWYSGASKREKELFSRIVPDIGTDSPAFRLISFGMKSRARLVIVPMQDYLSLGSEARMNRPGTPRGNWEWRLDGEYLNDKAVKTVILLSAGRNN